MKIIYTVMRNFSITILFLFIAESATSQVQRTNHWYFGYYAGLDFSTGVPKAVKGSLNTSEGNAAISTPTGRLLFYTDGITVWDSLHALMPNGDSLFSHTSSTQAAIIIPVPEDSAKYYIVTSDQGGYAGNLTRGINYSVIDMHLNAGRGAVTLKNIPLLTPQACEKLTATYHCNGSDVWVLAHGWTNNKFYAWLVTKVGISAPVISSVGSVHTGNLHNTIGYMKFSPNGKKLALATTDPGTNLVELFNFDNATGAVSNAVSLPPEACDYGVSFSPDNSRLYISADCAGTTGYRVYQYNLETGNPDSIRASKTLLAYNKNIYSGMQLAPDGKIYVANEFDSTLSVITYPNSLGVGCQFVEKAIKLLDGRSSRRGLPNFIESYFDGPPLQLTLQVPQPDHRLPGDIISLPVFLSATKPLQQGEKISFEITYDSDLLKILDTPTSNNGSVKNYILDEQNGKISFVIELTKTVDASQTIAAVLPFQILLSSHTYGSIETIASIVSQSGCAVPTSTNKTLFTLDENCVKAIQLKRRSTATISAVYPNPSQGRTIVEITSHGNPKVKVEIIDTFGRVVEKLADGELSNGDHEIELHTEHYSHGIYFCRLIHNNSIAVTPFIVK